LPYCYVVTAQVVGGAMVWSVGTGVDCHLTKYTLQKKGKTTVTMANTRFLILIISHLSLL
jgi:hypothetical protein